MPANLHEPCLPADGSRTVEDEVMPTTSPPTAPGSSRSALPASLSPVRIRELTAAVRGTGDRLPVLAPFTGEQLVVHQAATAHDVTEAAAQARAAQRSWESVAPRDRAAVLLRLHDAILDNADALLDLIQVESGKARSHAFEEIADVVNVCRYYGRVAAAVLSPQRRSGVFPLLTSTTVTHRPVGLVGLITPWNYPFTLGIADALPALVAGNAVLHKPDTQTVLSALAGRELAVDAGLPPELWQVVVGEGAIVGPAVIEQADHVTFTGSTATGRTVAAQAAGRLIGSTLELGGKNAMIVCRDARIGAAVAGAVRGCFSSAGQLCLSIERIYLAEPIAEEFTRQFVAATRALRLGAGYDYRSDMGSLTSAAQLARVGAHVQDALAQGATVLAGGASRPDIGPYFFEPTVLSNVPPHARCYAEETFGPVVALYPVATEDEAVQRANESSYGLNASVWAKDARRGRKLAGRLRSGAVNINEAYAATWGSVAAPMGGWGDSGSGRRHGPEGLLATTWSQTVATQRLWPVGERSVLRGRRYQWVMTGALRALRRTRRR